MKATKDKSKAFRFAFYFVLIFASLISGLWNVFNLGEGYYFYDDASYNLVASDIEYNRQYGLDGAVVRHYRINDTTADGVVLANNILLLEHIHSENGMPQQNFHYYTSNICIQRYFFALLAMLPLGMPAVLKLLEVISMLLFSAVMAAFLLWISKISNIATANVLLIIITLFSPIITNFASNLYWLPYTWFLPLLASAYMVQKYEKGIAGNSFNKKRWQLFTFLAAFIACLFKQLHYFEFISCVMVTMMLPYIIMLLQNKPKGGFKAWVSVLLSPALGALSSFAVAVGAKLIVLNFSTYTSEYGGASTAWQEFMFNMVKRTASQSEEAALAAKGYSTDFVSVIHQMLNKRPLVMRGMFIISFYSILAVLIAISVYCFWLYKAKQRTAPRLNALLITAWVSLTGPFSWFILARLHVVDHIMIDAVVWYIPFAFIAYSAIIYFATLCLKGFKASLKNKL